MGGVNTAFADVEGGTDLSFLPGDLRNHEGQGIPGTRGLAAVLAGMRPDCVLFRELTGESLEPLGFTLEAFAECFEWR